ncbi:hypothetical protein [Maribacter cobaltidurans]|uniref:Uncharacterized protein n=1 Tax=Maribacter cobaltidurans TaxID=1178778 RepID=A0A223V268_9FLAO|nr:hypothetical protein [Maribacter cobaltidurans]ASV28939.1 hypothetical protein CJ263_01090 [Maribacter cobaltidurans]GGD73525.1 hypothetical protein GCM10011412_08980 [Maribacter cobaltidurans]
MFSSYLFILNVLALLTFSEFTSLEPVQRISSQNTVSEQDSFKKNAFNVLEKKCNVCHVSKKRVQNFTLQNMDSLSKEINKQVFVKKKMPKGNKIALSVEDIETLKLWLRNLDKK